MAVSSPSRRLVRERAQLQCEYCHADERWQFIRFTTDHVLPQSAGGSDDPDNLALACRNCNERRGNRVEGRDPQTGHVAAIFHPRLETWATHFAWAAAGIRIVGLTPIGRATVELLDLNDDRHNGVVLRTRQRDVSDGYHPPPEDPVLSE
ncbi:MAG: HNH endonuclease [Deltaproteobacteria bacterium]|nr:HNH endonuclease [Deltaproteobacteria bacterium]